MRPSCHVSSAMIFGEALEDEDLGDLVAPEYYDHPTLAVPGPPGPTQRWPLGAAELGGAARVRADHPVAEVDSPCASETWSACAAASRVPGLRAGDAGGAGRLVDLAIAAAFAGGLGVGGELDGFLARAVELLDGEGDSFDFGDAVLVAQVLAGGVAEVRGPPRVIAAGQNLHVNATRAA